jgi:hypothetical protein
MSQGFVIENRVRGGKVVVVSVQENKYNAAKDVYRHCNHPDQSAWVRKQIEEAKMDANAAAESVLNRQGVGHAAKLLLANKGVAGRVIQEAVKVNSKRSHPKSLKKNVLAYLDGHAQQVADGSISEMQPASLVNLIAAEFDITKANARYYITRVWKR